jgi:hypothetical protein
MKIQVTYDETYVVKALSKIIKDPNAEEFVKLLGPMLCHSNNATNWFFKLMLDDKLPEVIPTGTLCKISVNNLGYSCNKDAIRAKYGDENGNVVVTVKEFRGYHDYNNYHIQYTSVDASGNDKIDTTFVQADELEVIEEI